LVLLILIFFYSACKNYLDLFDSYSDALSVALTFTVIWPIYLYLSIILSDRAIYNFSQLYVRALSICSPKAINELKVQRLQVKASVRELIDKFVPEIFPNLKIKNHPKAKFELNDSLNDAFGLLSEIGFN